MHYAYIDEAWSQPYHRSAAAATAAAKTDVPDAPPSVKQPRPTMDRSPQDIDRNAVHNIAAYLDSLYKTYGFNKIAGLLPETFVGQMKERFVDARPSPGPTNSAPTRRITIDIDLDSLLTFALSAILVFVFYDALSSAVGGR